MTRAGQTSPNTDQSLCAYLTAVARLHKTIRASANQRTPRLSVLPLARLAIQTTTCAVCPSLIPAKPAHTNTQTDRDVPADRTLSEVHYATDDIGDASPVTSPSSGSTLTMIAV
ncbi:unnamed protein product [Protopolystoma xenopodis]|uniref:Uncharacterized protein n=1 Tax=Protopolystoma xenopodis TaxID=117903 RepID=A0A3S5CV18_9PLAT|nr:unnamed protein product [Protopolystoma xenopodis]